MILSSLYFIFLFGRPTYLSADLRFTRILLIFVSYLSPLNGNQPYPAMRSEVSAISKCMSEILNILPLYRSGPQNIVFRRLRSVKANVKAYIFGMKHGIHNRASALTIINFTRGLLHRPKTQGRRHGFESGGGTNSASKASRKK